METKFYYTLPKGKRALGDMEHIWDHYIAPFRMAPHVYSVGGNDDVSCYLLDSGDGLILIDTGMEQTLYLMIDSIWRLGYDPRNIKKILISHWHGDHTNGARLLKEMTGAEIYLSREDEEMHQLHADDTKPFPTLPYTVDHFYDEKEPIRLGRFEIHTRLTPGHTPGATSFFFEDKDEDTGAAYRCAMHGGLGINQMKRDYLEKSGLDLNLPERFINDCLAMAEEKVDIMLPSHLNQGNIEPNIPEDRNDYSVFVDSIAWGLLMKERAEAVSKLNE